MKLTSLSRPLLGTNLEVRIAAFDSAKAEYAINLAFAEAERIERLYSRFLENNELSRLNSNLGEWTEISEEFHNLIAFGLRVRNQSQGAFDLSVKSILDSWGYDSVYSLRDGEPGKLGQIELSDPKQEATQVRISAPIDLGGLGKGYAVDRMTASLEGFANILIDAGGDGFARGTNEAGGAWEIGLEHPLEEQKIIGKVEVNGFAYGASGTRHRRWKTENAGPVHHLVNPLAKNSRGESKPEPADKMLAVFTQAKAAILADAYSTALFALGYEEARELLPKLPVEAMLVGMHGEICISAEFQGEIF